MISYNVVNIFRIIFSNFSYRLRMFLYHFISFFVSLSYIFSYDFSHFSYRFRLFFRTMCFICFVSFSHVFVSFSQVFVLLFLIFRIVFLYFLKFFPCFAFSMSYLICFRSEVTSRVRDDLFLGMLGRIFEFVYNVAWRATLRTCMFLCFHLYRISYHFRLFFIYFFHIFHIVFACFRIANPPKTIRKP